MVRSGSRKKQIMRAINIRQIKNPKNAEDIDTANRTKANIPKGKINMKASSEKLGTLLSIFCCSSDTRLDMSYMRGKEILLFKFFTDKRHHISQLFANRLDQVIRILLEPGVEYGPVRLIFQNKFLGKTSVLNFF